MDRARNARNIAIVLVIAAAVYAVPGGGRAASTFEAVLLAGFGLGIGYLGLRQYRENRIALHGLGDRYRALLYGALALGAFALTARQRMWDTGLGELVWYVLVGFAVYGGIDVNRHCRI